MKTKKLLILGIFILASLSVGNASPDCSVEIGFNGGNSCVGDSANIDFWIKNSNGVLIDPTSYSVSIDGPSGLSSVSALVQRQYIGKYSLSGVLTAPDGERTITVQGFADSCFFESSLIYDVLSESQCSAGFAQDSLGANCKVNDHKKCSSDNKLIVWYDSCGKKGARFADCGRKGQVCEEWTKGAFRCTVPKGGTGTLTAKFKCTPTPVDVGKQISCDASSSTGTIRSYNWEWGDASRSKTRRFTPIASKTYNNAGDYTIRLVIDGNGTSKSTSQTITVLGSGGGSGSFSCTLEVSPSSIVPPGQRPTITVNYKNLASRPGSVVIDCGADGGNYRASCSGTASSGSCSTSTEKCSYGAVGSGNPNKPATVIASFGAGNSCPSKTLTLKSSDSGGTSAPVSDFGWSPNNPRPRESVSFTDNTQPDQGVSITKWEWDFNDGSTSISQNPRHSFTSSKTYRVRLKVTDGNGKTAEKSKDVTVSTSGSSDCVSGKTKSCKVSNGCSGTRTCESGRWGSCVQTNSNCGTSGNRPDFQAISLTLTPNNPGSDNGITYSAKISNNGNSPTSTEVRFKLDNKDVSSSLQTISQSKTVIYQGNPLPVGTHKISVEVDPNKVILEEDETNNFLTQTFSVTSRGTSNNIPTCLFRPSTNVQGEAPLKVIFSLSASDRDGDLKNCKLNIGDNTLFTGNNTDECAGVRVEKVFDQEGIYAASCVVQDQQQATNSKSIQVEVLKPIPPPVAGVTQSAGVALNTLTAFQDESTNEGEAIVSFWDLGDGTTKTGADIEYSYSEEGAYSVVHGVLDDRGNGGLFVSKIKVTEEGTAKIDKETTREVARLRKGWNLVFMDANAYVRHSTFKSGCANALVMKIDSGKLKQEVNRLNGDQAYLIRTDNKCSINTDLPTLDAGLSLSKGWNVVGATRDIAFSELKNSGCSAPVVIDLEFGSLKSITDKMLEGKAYLVRSGAQCNLPPGGPE